MTRVTRTTRAVGCNGQPESVVRRARCKVVSCEMLGWGRKGEQQAETRQGRLVAVMWFNRFWGGGRVSRRPSCYRVPGCNDYVKPGLC